MASNDQVILNHLLEKRKQTIAPELHDSSFFELFVSEQLLKNYDLSYDEIEAGVVGKGNDGGIDSLYCFVNGQLVGDDPDFSSLKSNITIDLIIIQSKTSAGFTENVLSKFILTTQDLLDLTNPIDVLLTTYNSKLLNNVGNFRKVYLDLSNKFPEFNVTYYYASKGDEVHPNVQRRVAKLEQTVKQIFSNCNFAFRFIGARELLDLVRHQPTETLPLKVAETPISTGQIASICLVNLSDYYAFITDEHGELRRGIFEANVRGYLGDVDVNRAIGETLTQTDAQEDFWWLNNGITILASEAPLNGKILTIRDAQIVNGLQTSMEVYSYFRKAEGNDVTLTSRNILVRVIVPPTENSRNRIIKATNNQTNIPIASLRATERIHEDIEQFFETQGLFYDRRKNYYKNLGYPMNQIVSITYLAQAVIAILLHEPSISRSKPAAFIRDKKSYERVFNTSYPISLFCTCAKVLKAIDTYLLSENIPDEIRGHENNVKFHLAMFAVAKHLQKTSLKPSDIQNIQVEAMTPIFLQNCLECVWSILQGLKKHRQVDETTIARSREFEIAVKGELHADLGEGEFTIPLSEWERRLEAFIQQHGHSSLSRRDPETAELARWVTDLRIKKRHGLLPPETVARYDKMGINWNPIEERWEQRYEELVKYKEQYGDCNVPIDFPDNPSLVHWVRNQRIRKETLSERQRELLEKIGFEWRVTTRASYTFEERLEQLREYKEEYGHVNVPQKDPQYDGLGRWLNGRRTAKYRGMLPDGQEQDLTKMGIIWNTKEARWESRLEELQTFYEKYGHFKVPTKSEEFPGLGYWLAHLRRGRIDDERLKKLKDIGYDWNLERAIPRRKKKDGRK
jgi:hypothetical protein